MFTSEPGSEAIPYCELSVFTILIPVNLRTVAGLPYVSVLAGLSSTRLAPFYEVKPTDSRRFLDELSDRTGEFSGRIFGEERIAVRDLDELAVREQLCQSSSMFVRHDPVLCCPDDERWTVEGTQPLVPLEKHPLRGDAQSVLAKIAPDLRPGLQGSEPPVHDLVG